MKKGIAVYEEDHNKIAVLIRYNKRYKTMAEGLHHIIERYEALVRPLRPLSPDEYEFEDG